MRPNLLAVAAVLACLAPAAALAQREVPARSGPWSVEVIDEWGGTLPTFEHRGRTYVLGTMGGRYLLRFRNGSARRVEVVASVDGRDVMDGAPSALDRRGYVVEPYGEITIDGYRLSLDTVAAFRFSSVPRSYAARKGDARDVGVIGVAVFPERVRVYAPPPPPAYPPYPGYPYPSYPAPERSGAAEAPAPAPGLADGSAPPAASAPGAAAPQRGLAQSRPGLGTEFGEEHASSVQGVSFERAGGRPAAVLTVRYDDRAGLLALGVDVDGRRWARGDEAWRRETATPFRRDAGFCEPPDGWAGGR